jgi:hypothetical protein
MFSNRSSFLFVPRAPILWHQQHWIFPTVRSDYPNNILIKMKQCIIGEALNPTIQARRIGQRYNLSV